MQPAAGPAQGAALIHLRFDRGTLLLEGALEDRAERVPALLWDERVCAFRAPAHRHPEVRAAIQQLDVPLKDEIASARGRSVALRAPSLRPYQQEALLAWEMAGRRGLLVLPTGSGKTVVGLAAIARVERPAVVLVPTRVLLEQWAAALRAHYRGPLGILGDGSRTVQDLTVATFESAYRHMDDFGDRFGLLVVDEVHHFGSGARIEALEMCAAPARLGLTATPPEQEAAAARLAAVIGKVVFELSIGDLSGRHLAPFDHVRLLVELTREERQAYEKERLAFDEAFRAFRRSAPGSQWADFVRSASLSAAGRRALRGFHGSRRIVSSAVQKLALVSGLLRRHRGERTLIFTADNAAAYAISRRLLVPALTCEIGREERRAVLDRFRRGELHTLVSARVLNEGIDVPEARVGIITGGTQGSREHVQRVGRLLRAAPGKRALVYELVARDTFEFDHSRRRALSLVPRAAS
jgi:superfamily II DNA or RNA helicase